MQLEVEPAGIADGFTLVVPPPQRGGGGAAVRTAQPDSTGNARLLHSPLWFHDGSGGAIHLVVEPTRVAQVVAGAIPAPQGRGDGATVDAFSGFTEPSILRRVCRPRAENIPPKRHLDLKPKFRFTSNSCSLQRRQSANLLNYLRNTELP